MTRNRDDFSTAQAIRNGVLGMAAILVLMTALGTVISSNKADAAARAAAMGNVVFTDEASRLATTATPSRG